MKDRQREIDKQQKELGRVQKKTCSWSITSALIVAVFFMLIHERAIAKGLLLGTCFSIINFILMGRSIPMTLGQSRAKASLIGLVSILSRYVVLAIPMIMAIKMASFNFVAVVVGIFAVQIITLVDHILIRPALDGK
jgi:hypothetical protein